MKTLKIILAFFVLTMVTSGCLYNFILPEAVPPTDPDDPNAPEISFKTDIIPIFNNNNNCTACHKTGSTPPDLTEDNAYNSINNSRYINTTSTEESRIYTIPHPDQSGHSQKKYTEAQAANVLLWINQGANNN